MCQSVFKILSGLNAHNLARAWEFHPNYCSPDNWDLSKHVVRQFAEIPDLQVETTPSGEVRSGFLSLGCRPFAATSHTSSDGRFGAFDSPYYLRQGFSSTRSGGSNIRCDCTMRETEADALAVIIIYTFGDDTNCEFFIEGILLKPWIE
jgi:hypothetical protein